MTDVKSSPLAITDVILRDAHQSLLATRMRLEDMLPIAEKLDQVGFWALESWGGATFDACIRYLGEDPWDRIRQFKAAMPNTPQQMLFRGQNILGYRHYADDVVRRFVERAAVNGVDVFRIFDAMNDMRNLEMAIKAAKECERHAQGAMSYTISPVYTLQSWLDMARQIEDMGADSLCIKDMAGLLKPYVAYELVSKLKETVSIPIHMQCHATTGLSTATYIKAIEAGIDNLDTAISSMSMTYGHSPTETIVSILEGMDRDTGLDIKLLEEIASYFRVVRRKYAQFEGSLRGIDSRILVAQVPGGMLTNLENQLKEQNAVHRLDEVLEEIPKVRADLGYIPLVTPTSQIVGTQAALNILMGERYKSVTRETEGVLRGEYGATPAAVNEELRASVLKGAEPISCRPADLLQPEFEQQREELIKLSAEQGFALHSELDDTLTYTLFPHAGLKFLQNRGNPDAFEPAPSADAEAAETAVGAAAASVYAHGGSAPLYSVEVDGKAFSVRINDGDPRGLAGVPANATFSNVLATSAPVLSVLAPVSANVYKILIEAGKSVKEGDVIVVLETMKMETEIRSPLSGKVVSVDVQQGAPVRAGASLVSLS